MDGIPHREVPPPQNRTRKNCRQTECFNVAFVVRADLTIQTKGLTASALAAKFRDEFETVRCGMLRYDEGELQTEGGGAGGGGERGERLR